MTGCNKGCESCNDLDLISSLVDVPKKEVIVENEEEEVKLEDEKVEEVKKSVWRVFTETEDYIDPVTEEYKLHMNNKHGTEVWEMKKEEE